MAFVYWIKLPEHTELDSQGYIGVTDKTPEARLKSHLKDCNRKDRAPYHFQNVLKKHKEKVEVVTLLEGSLQYCYDIEKALRPLKRIGWNTAVGGQDALAYKERVVKHSKASKEKMRLAQKESWKENRDKKLSKLFERRLPQPIDLSIVFKRYTKGRRPDVWAKAAEAYDVYKEVGPRLTSAELGERLGIADSKQLLQKLIKGFEAGFNPRLDAIWQEKFGGDDASHT